MILTDIWIDGFGKFHQRSIDNIHSKLTIFLGSNETGKSTIINFIKRVLFGFLDRRSTVNLYPALDGGNHGGRIFVSHHSGTYTIERYSGDKNSFKVVLPNGDIGSSQDFNQLVGNINREVFDNIFAFGLDELQNFETLNSDSIKEQLYSAGKGMGNFSLKDFLKDIENKTGKLYKDKGSNPDINIMFKDLTELTKQIIDIRRDSAKFDELTHELEKTNLEMENNLLEKKQVQMSIDQLSKKLNAWEDYQKLRDSQEKLTMLPYIDSFPEDGSITLKHYLKAKESIAESLLEKKEKLDKIQSKKSTLSYNEKLINNKDKINDIQKRQQQYIQADKDLPTIQAKYQREKEELDSFLAKIGTIWTPEKLAKIDTSIPTNDKIRKYDKRLKELSQNIQLIETDIRSLEKDKRTLLDSKNELEISSQKLITHEKNKEELLEKRNSLNHIKANQVSLKELEATLLNIQYHEQAHALMKSKQPAKSKTFNWFSIAIILVSLSIAGLVFTSAQNHYLTNIFMGLFFLISLFILIVSGKQNKMKAEQSREISNEISESLQKPEPEKKKKVLDEIQKLSEENFQHAQICAFSKIPTLYEIETLDQAIQESLKTFDKKEDILDQIKILSGKIEKIDIEVEEKLQEKEKWNAKKKTKTEEWENFLFQHHLEGNLSPEAVIDTFSTLKAAFGMKEAMETSLDRIKLMDDCIRDFHERCSALNIALNRIGDQSISISALESIYQDLEESITNKEKLKSLQTEEDDLKIERNRSLEEQTKNEKDIEDLLCRGFADSIDQFLKNETVYKNRIELTKEMEICEKNIKKFCGGAKSYESFLMDLESTSFDSLKEKEIELTQTLEAIEAKHDQHRNKQGSVSKEIEQIEKREEGTILRIKKSAQIEKVNQKAREWSTLVLSKAIMKKAIEKYEREKQPDIIKESQIFFSLMTLERYPYIYAPINESRINVVEKNGNQKEVRELSKGTAEQLYLALRFGFIREFSKRSESLPIIFDDVFVNFDPERFSASCKAVKELSNTHQLLYFTCHPDSANLMKKVIPNSKLVELGAV